MLTKVLNFLELNFPEVKLEEPLLKQVDSIFAVNYIIALEEICEMHIDPLKLDMNDLSIKDAIKKLLDN